MRFSMMEIEEIMGVVKIEEIVLPEDIKEELQVGDVFINGGLEVKNEIIEMKNVLLNQLLDKHMDMGLKVPTKQVKLEALKVRWSQLPGSFSSPHSSEDNEKHKKSSKPSEKLKMVKQQAKGPLKRRVRRKPIVVIADPGLNQGSDNGYTTQSSKEMIVPSNHQLKNSSLDKVQVLESSLALRKENPLGKFEIWNRNPFLELPQKTSNVLAAYEVVKEDNIRFQEMLKSIMYLLNHEYMEKIESYKMLSGLHSPMSYS